MTQRTGFDARFAFADNGREKFRVLDVKDRLGADVSDQVSDPHVFFPNVDALKVSIAGKLGLEPANIDVQMIEDDNKF
ncbi:hypothetical protein GAO09_04885 [Rhizobiales bacterium RZME27]|jgi:hypothetical protein|uniref:Uncharacterized protein n=1 Tax=Endobacterium cereale TaxID=2663029 RepID=A0A6A8A6X6_9HYPH|nr:hypothetical protein [Endobacterium cereale]MEB2846527.1 hypothetical protein [Endobacterium cereale]MQY45400.1 hypothetical protein [Endobacterium cereale]